MAFDYGLSAFIEDDTETIDSKPTYYTIKMTEVSNKELPLIVNDAGVLYNQTIALFGTINKGQLEDAPSFGFTPSYKVFSLYDNVSRSIYTTNLLGELQEMISAFFIDNPEILDFAQKQYSEIVITKGK